MNQKGVVLDIDRFSTHDGPGIRTSIFLKGCPLSCKWCHSPESQSSEFELLYHKMQCIGCGKCASACPHDVITHEIETKGIKINREKCTRCYACVKSCPSKALIKCGKEYTTEELIASIKDDIPFFKNSGGGVTVSGGEPLLQPAFVYEFLSGCHDLGIDTLLQTSGHGSWEDLKRISKYCSTIYFDIKLLDSEQHKEWTGHINATIHDNLKSLCMDNEGIKKITICIPCIPGINDSIINIEKIIFFVKDMGIKSVRLLPYNNMAGERYSWIDRDFYFKDSQSRNKEYYEELYDIAEKAGLDIIRN